MTIYRMIRGSIVEGFKADIWDDSLKTDLHSLFASDQTASNKKGKKFLETIMRSKLNGFIGRK